MSPVLIAGIVVAGWLAITAVLVIVAIRAPYIDEDDDEPDVWQVRAWREAQR